MSYRLIFTMGCAVIRANGKGEAPLPTKKL